jgi:hypothetical protein
MKSKCVAICLSLYPLYLSTNRPITLPLPSLSGAAYFTSTLTYYWVK